MRMHVSIAICCIAVVLGACAQRPRPSEPPASSAIPVPVPQAARPRFTIEASKNDTWNAVGQILVRTPGVEYDGRPQMLGLYAIRYRGEPLMVLTQALPLSDAITRSTTEVTVTTPRGQSIASDGTAEVMTLLERALPAEIETVKAQFAAGKKAKEKTKARKRKKEKK
jgi:hypothetical protein